MSFTVSRNELTARLVDSNYLNTVDMIDSSFIGAQMYSCDLRRADLTRVDFSGALLEGVDMRDAIRPAADPPIPGWSLYDAEIDKSGGQMCRLKKTS